MSETEHQFFDAWHGARLRLLAQVDRFVQKIERDPSDIDPLIIKEFMRTAGEIAKRKIRALPRPTAFDPQRYGDFEFYHAVTEAGIGSPAIGDLFNFNWNLQRIDQAPGWEDFVRDHNAQLEFERFLLDETPKVMETHMLTGYIEHLVVNTFIREMVEASSAKHHTFDDEHKPEETEEAEGFFQQAVRETITAGSYLKLKLAFAD